MEYLINPEIIEEEKENYNILPQFLHNDFHNKNNLENLNTNELNSPKEDFEKEDNQSINYENLYLNTESNVILNSGNYNENNSDNFDQRTSEIFLNEYFPNTIENNLSQNNPQNQISPKNEVLIKPCYICESNPIEYTFICGNGCCMECLISHITSILEKYKQKIFSEKIKFVCVGSCKCILENETIIKIIEENKLLSFLHNEVLFKMHISKSDDIISCPKSNCSNYGFLEAGSKSSCFECNLCQSKIPNPNEFTLYSILEFLNEIKFSNFRSYMLKLFTTKFCNKCKSPIEKAEGCKHIECNRCEYSFCWKCTGDWTTHSQSACMGIYSNPWDDSEKPNFFSVLLINLIILTSLKFISSFYVLFKLYYFFMAILFCLGIATNIFYVVLFYENKTRNRGKAMIIPSIVLFVVESLLYYYHMHPLSEKVYFYMQIFCDIGVGCVLMILNLKKRRLN